MLPNLNAYPLPNGASPKGGVPVMTRRLVHEIGHIVAAADAGIPTDYVIIDSNGARDAAYVDPIYRTRIASDATLNSRLLASGLSAEMAVFGEVDLFSAHDDLKSLADLLGISKTEDDESWMKETFFCSLHQQLLPINAIEIIRPTYARLVVAIEIRRFLIDRAHVIPIEAYHNLALPLPQPDYWRARERTKSGIGCKEMLATLRRAPKSRV
jgi:hypothetical protein